MPITTQVLLHKNYELVDGKPVSVLWREHKPLSEVLSLRDTTPSTIWSGTYQGLPTAPEGTVFLREWWEGKNRFYDNDMPLKRKIIGRWISWDTAMKDEKDSAYSSMLVGELTPAYQMMISFVYRAKLEFPDLPNQIEYYARRFNVDGKLRAVIIENKASGISAFQTIVKTSEPWLVQRMVAFEPSGDKETRAKQGAVWCKNGCIWLPYPDDSVPWLIDFEDELFNFPGTQYMDQVDSLSQMILYTENLLSEGYMARSGSKKQ